MIFIRLLRVQKTDRQKSDKNSLLLIWILIIIGNVSAVFVTHYFRAPIGPYPVVGYVGLGLIILGITDACRSHTKPWKILYGTGNHKNRPPFKDRWILQICTPPLLYRLPYFFYWLWSFSESLVFCCYWQAEWP